MSNTVNEMITNNQESALIKSIRKHFGVMNTSEEINNKIADILLELQNHKNEVIVSESQGENLVDIITDKQEIEKGLLEELGMPKCVFYWGKNGIIGIDARGDIYSFSKKIYKYVDDEGNKLSSGEIKKSEIDTATEIKVLKNGLVAASHYRGGGNDPVKHFEYTVYQKNGNPLAISYEEYVSL